jgi:hypothetical protein
LGQVSSPSRHGFPAFRRRRRIRVPQARFRQSFQGQDGVHPDCWVSVIQTIDQGWDQGHLLPASDFLNGADSVGRIKRFQPLSEIRL